MRAARQAHCKSRAFARLARHCHVAAHHAGELAGNGKAETGAAEPLRRRLAYTLAKCFDTALYSFGDTRAFLLALLIFTALSG